MATLIVCGAPGRRPAAATAVTVARVYRRVTEIVGALIGRERVDNTPPPPRGGSGLVTGTDNRTISSNREIVTAERINISIANKIIDGIAYISKALLPLNNRLQTLSTLTRKRRKILNCLRLLVCTSYTTCVRARFFSTLCKKIDIWC